MASAVRPSSNFLWPKTVFHKPSPFQGQLTSNNWCMSSCNTVLNLKFILLWLPLVLGSLLFCFILFEKWSSLNVSFITTGTTWDFGKQRYSEKLWCFFLVHHRCLILRGHSLNSQERYSPVTTQLVTRGHCGSMNCVAGISGNRCRQSSAISNGTRISAVSGVIGLGTAGQSSLHTHWASTKGAMNCRLCHPKPLGDNKKKKAKKKSWKGLPNSQSCSFSTDITPPLEQAKAKGGGLS